MIKANEKKDKLFEWVARFLPHRLAYWAYIRMVNKWSKEGLLIEYKRRGE